MTKTTFAGLKKRPKTRKEWQEWQRKFALGFLYGQLDRLVKSATKKDQIISLFTKWEQRFRTESANKPPEERPNGNNLMEDQIDFIAQYIACALCDGTSKQNFGRIRHFLSLQTWDNNGVRIELRFWGGSPIEAYAYVDALDDIDIADVLLISSFETMQAYRDKGKLWTKNTAQCFFDKLKRDILFDMPNTVIIADPADSIGRQCFTMSVKADETDLNMQLFRCYPFKELKHSKFNHLRC